MTTLFNRLKFHILGFFAGLLIPLVLVTMLDLFGWVGAVIMYLVSSFGIACYHWIFKKPNRNSRRSIDKFLEMNTKKHEHDPENLMLAASCALGITAAKGIIYLVMR